MVKKREKTRYAGAQPFGILPYVAMVCIALMYTLCRQYVVICSVIMIALCCGFYYLIYHISQKHRVSASPLGRAVIPVVLVALCFGIMTVVGVYSSKDVALTEEGSFTHFLFTASLSFDPVNAAAAIALFSLIIGFVSCYFSVILPRAGLLTFPTLIPIILSQSIGGLPLWMNIAMFGLLLLAVMCSAAPCEAGGTAEFTNQRSRKLLPAAGAVMAAIIVAVCSAVPKSEEALLEEQMETLSGMAVSGFSHGGNELTNFSMSSSVNRGANQTPDNLLFTVQTQTPVNIDRWTFDIYNGEKGWTAHPDYDTGGGGWEDLFRLHRMPLLMEQLKTGAENGALEQYSDMLLSLPDTAPLNGLMFVKVMDGSSTSVVLHPLGTYNVTMEGYEGKFYRIPKGEIFTRYNVKGAQYLLRYAAEQPNEQYVAALRDVDFLQLLQSAHEEDLISGDTRTAFETEYHHALDYRDKVGLDGISPEIIQLSQEITADCENDLQKAQALERWFGAEEFIYDMNFVPLELTADYFLFESKTGICSDFATAMTLMARAAGLSARYVEGFALSEDIRDSNGVYNVTGADAHAYTQIYIKGAGWVNFDATSYAIPAETLTPLWVIVLLIVLAFLLVLTIAGLIFRKKLSYLLLVITYPVRKDGSRIRGVALKMRELACDITGRQQESMSMGEAEKILRNTLSMPEEAAAIRSAADSLMYNDSTEGQDTKALLKNLKALRRQKRRLRK